MAFHIAKQLLPNQHDPLHFLYGNYDCCLCKSESRIRALENEILELKKQLALKELENSTSELRRTLGIT